jgi:hypothetical protein
MAARRYQNFDLSLEAARDGSFRARVGYCPAGEFPPVAFSLPLEATQLEILMLKLDPGRSGSRRAGVDSQRQACADLGGILFEAVFRDDVMLAWSRSQDVTRAAGEGLRLRLRLTDAPQVAGLPWELLFDRRTNSYVAQSDRTPVVRYLEVPQPPRPLTVGGALRILVILASPTDLPDLDVEAEWRRVREATSATVQTGAVVIDRLPAPTMAELSAWLGHHDVHILHFVGHGDYDQRIDSGVVYFCDQYGRSVAVGPDTLGPFLHDHDPLRLVLLNACRSARVDATDPFGGMAQGLVQQDVSAVVAMQFPISDAAAVAFTSAFYGAVSDGIPLDQAATEARKALLISYPGEWATPVLFLRAPDGRVFDQITAAHPTPGEPAKTGKTGPAGSAAAQFPAGPPSSEPAGSGSNAPFAVTAAPQAAGGRRRSWTRRRALTVIAAAVVLIIGGIVAAVLLLRSSNASTGPSTQGDGSYTATAPWRLRVDGTKYGNGCAVYLTDEGSGTVAQVASNVYGITKVQIHQVGSFRWQSSDRQCLVTPLAGSGAATLPFTQEDDGDTDAFTAPARGVSAQVKDYHGNGRCVLRLFDAADGQELDLATATPSADTVTLDPNGRPTVYLYDDQCVVRVSAQP